MSAEDEYDSCKCEGMQTTADYKNRKSCHESPVCS